MLRDINYDYDLERTGDRGVGIPRIRWAEPGAFAGWMRAMNKLGGQNKVPRVTPKADRFAAMAEALGVPLDFEADPAQARRGPVA